MDEVHEAWRELKADLPLLFSGFWLRCANPGICKLRHDIFLVDDVLLRKLWIGLMDRVRYCPRVLCPRTSQYWISMKS